MKKIKKNHYLQVWFLQSQFYVKNVFKILEIFITVEAKTILRHKKVHLNRQFYRKYKGTKERTD